jgi:type II secretory pathway pseudopilin PulG
MKTVFTKPLLKARRTDGDGFTLLELLVIVGMIAILVVLQLPALAGAKNQSTRAQCAGNLRQFALAMQIYAGENNDNLPTSGAGNWPWDLPWNAGNVITQWISSRLVFCPGTAVRFSDQDNAVLWNFGSPSYHLTGYALTSPGFGEIATNQNTKITPQSYSPGPIILPGQLPSQRVLLADATISSPGQYNYSQRYTYNWTSIAGGYAKAHISPHLRGQFPLGGNVGMLDGHIEWRKFDDMQCRVNSGSVPGFWW